MRPQTPIRQRCNPSTRPPTCHQRGASAAVPALPGSDCPGRSRNDDAVRDLPTGDRGRSHATRGQLPHRKHAEAGGAAAGTISAQARRDAIHGAGDPAAVTRDLQLVAEQLHVATARLRMLHYQEALATNQELTSLGEIVGAYGSWKAAREAAAQDSTE